MDKDNWIIGSDEQHPDIFSVMKKDAQITVTRTDSQNSPWGLNLAFQCCFKGATLFKFKFH